MGPFCRGKPSAITDEKVRVFAQAFDELRGTMLARLPLGYQADQAMARLTEAFWWVSEAILVHDERYGPKPRTISSSGDDAGSARP